LSAPPPVAGDVLVGRYRLLSKLGSGAMGDVFVAENVTIGLRVAVKLLKPELTLDASFQTRFQREAEIAAGVAHPNIARILDLIVGPPTFLVMEYVKGESLAERLAAHGKLPVEVALELARELASGLVAVHAAGVVHRDLKPHNVMLTRDARGNEIPKLIDFGLAKLVGAGSLTRAGQLIGTPSYMAPEQIAARPIDVRSDVYALGCVLYQMLTGEPPFVADQDLQVLYRHVHDQHEPLAQRLGAVDPQVSAIVDRALAKLPDDRFASMMELEDAIERVLRPKRTGFDPAARRSRAGLATRFAIGGVLLVAVAGAVGFTRSENAEHRAALLFATEPPGAHVFVDGRTLAETTPTLARALAPGPHTVAFEHPSRGRVERRVTLSPGQRDLLQVTLPPPTRNLEIRTVPDGARVYLDGQLVIGATPGALPVTAEDFHELRVEQAGYQIERRRVAPEDTASLLTVTLKPDNQPTATLTVDANASGEVWLDGVFTGFTTPTIGLVVRTGTHVVEVRSAGMRARPVSVTLRAGQNLRLTVPVEADSHP
jgi:hypothetical protein